MTTQFPTPATLTRNQWITACADHYLAKSAIGSESARSFAETCADHQAHLNGEAVSEWESPADAADEDMSYWESEE